MSIRKQLRLQAETELHEMITQLSESADTVCKDTPIGRNDLCRLVIGGRTQSVLNRCIGEIADRKEASVLAYLEDQSPSPENY